jgi:pimeloyl-ACP methyl ester carboxylesterase
MPFLTWATRAQFLVGSLVFALSAIQLAHGDSPGATQRIELRSTAEGVQYGVLDGPSRKPAPTLLVLASTPEKSLGDPDYLQCGAVLRRQGFLCASLDLPCHGADHRSNEPVELAGWAHRLDGGADLVGDFISRTENVLDHLIATGATDPERIAVCGVSRGGFMAFHLAARDERVRAVVAMAPVTRLAAVKEFQQLRHPERAEALSTTKLADRLADQKVWIAIGDRDCRVGTDETIAFARQLSASAIRQSLPPPVDLHVVGEAGGHTTPQGAAEQSARWVTRQFAGTSTD